MLSSETFKCLEVHFNRNRATVCDRVCGRELTGISWRLNSSSPRLSPPLSLNSCPKNDRRRLIEFVSKSASAVTGGSAGRQLRASSPRLNLHTLRTSLVKLLSLWGRRSDEMLASVLSRSLSVWLQASHLLLAVHTNCSRHVSGKV